MPLIAEVGRRSLRVRLVLALLYLTLTAGAVSMIYPFALMISNSFTSLADYQEFRLIPRYWHCPPVLFKKYLVDKNKIDLTGYEYGRMWYRTQDIRVAQRMIDPERSEIDAARSEAAGQRIYARTVYRTEDDLAVWFNNPQAELNRIVDDWQVFADTVPEIYRLAYFCAGSTLQWTPLDLRPQYRKWLRNRFDGDIGALNQAYAESYETFEQVGTPYVDVLRQRWLLPLDDKYLDWANFRRTLPVSQTWVITAEIAFQKYLRETYPQVEELVAATGLPLAEHGDLTLFRAARDRILPTDAYEAFVRRKCPVVFLRLDPSLTPDFQAFLEAKYRNFSPEARAQRLGTPFAELCPMTEAYSGQANDWIEFMEQKADLAKIGFHDPTAMYQDFLRTKYGDAKAVNRAYGWDIADLADVRLPVPYIDVHSFRARRGEIFRTYLFSNYLEVIKVIAVHGRALSNTIIYIILSIFGALTINPLAAYALSRFKLSYTNKILLFLLATMAFPNSVGMIPRFLMLKEFGMLNTFWALVLPGLANGYGIFLLKGFFDSLPAELYEAALIDGASEIVIFFRMSLPLTTPILAIMALGAFTHAYSAFMFAFLTCQDPKMWTLMVFLYEFQQTYPNYLVMASLVVSSVPTLLVFIFCQNIILRGIVVPSFK